MPDKKKKDGGTKPYGRWLTVFLISACMFTVGVLVGRGNAPVEFDIQELQNEIKALKARERQAEAERYQIEPGFYEALKKPVENRPREPEKPPVAKLKQSPLADKPADDKPAGDKKKVVAPRVPPDDLRKKSEKALRELGGGDKPLTIQVSSLKEHAMALRIEKELKAKGYQAYVITAMVPGKGVWHRVRLGAFADKQAAEPVMQKLKKEGQSPILVAK